MPQAWSKKDEKMYEEIRQQQINRGRSVDRAEEIAARTVNKRRREEGRTRSGQRGTSGTGNPSTQLEDLTVEQLRNRAAELQIEGRSDMNKDELINAIRKRT